MLPGGASAEPVLVVDDDADVRETMVMLLEEEGYQAASAANGREALLYLQRCPPPCLILLDLMMPLMNGWELRERLQQDPALAAIPVLVISAVADNCPSSAALGAAEYLVKPVDLDVLLEKVRSYCHGPEKRLAAPPLALIRFIACFSWLERLFLACSLPVPRSLHYSRRGRTLSALRHGCGGGTNSD